MPTPDDTSGRQAIGGSSPLGAQQTGNVTYGVMPEQVLNSLKQNPGATFVVIQQVRQGEQPQIWSSGDPAQTKALYRSSASAFDRQHENT